MSWWPAFRHESGTEADRRLSRDARAGGCFRAPHHTASMLGILGGVRPRSDGWSFHAGEIHLATHGTLLLTDLPEFRAEVLHALGIAFQEGATIHPMGGNGVLRVPVFVRHVYTTAVDCPCGIARRSLCRCTPQALAWYRDRVHRALRLLGHPGFNVAPVR